MERHVRALSRRIKLYLPLQIEIELVGKPLWLDFHYRMISADLPGRILRGITAPWLAFLDECLMPPYEKKDFKKAAELISMLKQYDIGRPGNAPIVTRLERSRSCQERKGGGATGVKDVLATGENNPPRLFDSPHMFATTNGDLNTWTPQRDTAERLRILLT